MSRLSITGSVWHLFFPSREQKLRDEKAALDREIALLQLEKEVEEKRKERDKVRGEVDRLKSGLPSAVIEAPRRGTRRS